MSYQHIVFSQNPDEVDPFLAHLDATPEEDQHIVAGQYDHGDDDGRTVDEVPALPGEDVDRHGDYVVVRNTSLTYFSIYRDNGTPGAEQE